MPEQHLDLMWPMSILIISSPAVAWKTLTDIMDPFGQVFQAAPFLISTIWHHEPRHQSMIIKVNVGNPVINLPFGDGSNNPFLVILGMATDGLLLGLPHESNKKDPGRAVP